MSEEDILTTVEINNFIESYEVTKLEEIGKKRWFAKNATVVKLYQIAALEATMNCTERVKDAVSRYNKIDYFIKDLITLSVWKDKVLPELLNIRPEPVHSLPTYIILYNEVALVGLLQALLFYSEVFRDIDENCIDLIDYCVHKLTIINPDYISIKSELNLNCNTLDDIEKRGKEISLSVSTYCISLLRYICENLEYLPVNVASRLYSTHDVPILIAQLINNEVWTKSCDNKVYKLYENKWREWFAKDPPLSKLEVQTWLLMHQLLLNTTCATIYYFSNYRREQLSKLLRHLYVEVLDQLSPLVDLKHWLHTNSIGSAEGPQVHNPLIVEITHQYKDIIYQAYSGRWPQIALDRSKLLFYGNIQEMQFLVNGFSDCMENVEKLTDTLQSCLNCHSKATKRCSKCKSAWYCGRKCQVEHWSAHKHLCK